MKPRAAPYTFSDLAMIGILATALLEFTGPRPTFGPTIFVCLWAIMIRFSDYATGYLVLKYNCRSEVVLPLIQGATHFFLIVGVIGFLGFFAVQHKQ